MSQQPDEPDSGSAQWSRNANWQTALEKARLAPRCRAKRKHGRGPCHNPAIKGRTACRSHGGAGGAPHGKRNGNYKHGGRSLETMARRRKARAAIREVRALIRMIG